MDVSYREVLTYLQSFHSFMNIPLVTNFDNVVELIGKHVRPGTLICFETTLPVGTTRKRFCPIIEDNSELEIGKELHVVFSPERVSSGNIFEDLRKYPKIVGGVTKKCGEIAKKFYEEILDFDERNDLKTKNGVWLMKTPEDAEMTKLAETTYRDVNIALANQFYIFCERNKIDFYAIVEAANSQSFSNIHMPGISVGGHCIPVYPYFYLKNDNHASIVQEARKLNEEMPRFSISMIKENLGSLKNKNVVIEGISYRSKVKEVYGSGIWDLIPLLEEEEASVFVHDSKYSDKEIRELKLGNYVYKGQRIDLIIIHTFETETISFIKNISNSRTKIFDGRNYLANVDIEESASIFGFTKMRES